MKAFVTWFAIFTEQQNDNNILRPGDDANNDVIDFAPSSPSPYDYDRGGDYNAGLDGNDVIEAYSDEYDPDDYYDEQLSLEQTDPHIGNQWEDQSYPVTLDG